MRLRYSGWDRSSSGEAKLGDQEIYNLRIGVRKEAGQLLAHAWLEVGGRPVENTLGVLEKFTSLEKYKK